MTSIPTHCPSCQSNMVVTQVGCTNCDTTIVGNYPISSFFTLSSENLSFLEAFVKNRGNVKEMEREMDISYWSIRSKLDKIIEEMNSESIPQEAIENTRLDILARLRAGEIKADEAIQLLDELGR